MKKLLVLVIIIVLVVIFVVKSLPLFSERGGDGSKDSSFYFRDMGKKLRRMERMKEKRKKEVERSEHEYY